MKIIFASGDVGGARALIPIIDRCLKENYSVSVVDHGHIALEIRGEKKTNNLELISCETATAQIERGEAQVIVFASSLKDTTALTLARLCQSKKILVIHILDNWSSYRERMETDGLPQFIPDIYAVMDKIAYQDALACGIPESTLIITGHPALVTLNNEYEPHKRKKSNTLKELGFDPERLFVVFVSEPAENDQGVSDASSTYRGYTEKIVLRKFCDVLQCYADRIQVGVLPHPRENAHELDKLWKEWKGCLKGRLITLPTGRPSVFFADGIAGMASILLYEAWLLGKPVISIQPGLRNDALRMLGKREGLFFVDYKENLSESIKSWIQDVIENKPICSRPELSMHVMANDNILGLIKTHCKSRQ
jgi:hypothetical protein